MSVVKALVPLYNAEKVELVFKTKRTVTIEPWNEQIADLTFERKPLTTPDCVAIIDGVSVLGDICSDLNESGVLNLLSLIYDKCYYYNVVFTEKGENFIPWNFPSTPFHPGIYNQIVPKPQKYAFTVNNPRMMIKQDKVIDLISSFSNSGKIHLSLSQYYEASFRACSVEPKVFLYMALLEKLSNSTIDNKNELINKLSPETMERIKELIKVDCFNEKTLSDDFIRKKIGAIEGGIKDKIARRNNIEMLKDLIHSYCNLDFVPEGFISKAVSSRNKISHGDILNLNEAFLPQMLKDVCRLVILSLIIKEGDNRVNNNINYYLDDDFRSSLIPFSI